MRVLAASEKILVSKLNVRNNISALILRAVTAVQYGVAILKWTKVELKEMDCK